MSVLNTVDRVETKYPLVRKFGEPNFDANVYTTNLLKENGEAELKKNRDKLKDGHRYMQKEIGTYLYENSKSFLKTSESLRTVHNEFEELKTMMD